MHRVALGTRLAYWRRRAGLSGADLASSLGVSVSTISRWETGFTSPTADNVERYADACGISAAKVYGPLPRQAA